MRGPRRLALVALLLSGCEDLGCEPDPYAPPPRSSADRTGPGASGNPSERAKEALLGAPSPAAALETAQRALADKDYTTLVASIWPATRDAWLADLAVDLAVESTDLGHEPEGEKKRNRAEVRTLLARYGAVLSSRPRDISPGSLGSSLIDGVRDRTGLYAALLTFADARRMPFDPARVLTGASEASPSAVPLLRLTDRIKAPAALETSDGGVVESPADGPFALFVVSEGAPVVLRFQAKGRAYWLDES
jgi:hypothetical protein